MAAPMGELPANKEEEEQRKKMMKTEDIDEGLYSRQLYVLGAEAMKRMSSSSILIVGLSGLGCEIAKNLILAGAGSVSLCDSQAARSSDLSSNFYLSEADIGKPRAKATVAKLAELNTNVAVREVPEVPTEGLKEYQVVVYVDQCTSQLVEANTFCHANGVKFVSVESRGVCGMIFCDFGPKFEVYDVDGEEPVQCLVTGVTSAAEAAFTVHEDNRHNLEDGQKVLVTDIEGPAALNDAEWTVKVTGPFTFTINADTTSMPPYIRGGYIKPIKSGAVKDFLPLQEALAKPTFVDSKWYENGQLHVFFQALHQFIAKHGQAPAPYNPVQAAEVIANAQNIIKSYPDYGDLKVDILTKLAMASSGNLNPMAAFLGGFAAQEALKACSGKFTPIQQFFYFDAIECLPDPLPSPADCAPRGTRYDGQVAVFGQTFQQKLLAQNQFVVGAGALGCEFMKNFAMMGMGCSPEGKIIITDMDNIEKTNLSRQFLFRDCHIGKEKSTVAALQAQAMNPSLNVVAMCDKCAPETENTFDDVFWEKLTGVTNALDNVQARLYVDSKCVYYRKPLMESGTLGTKANTQTICPFATESYGSSRDPPEKDFPICTLKNFPNAIEHTIQWARDKFEGLFKQNADDVNGYLERKDFLEALEKEPSTRTQTLTGVYNGLVKEKPGTFKDCIFWARMQFEDYFHNTIEQLLYNFPIDQVTNSGERFWSGPKRPPTSLKFDPKDITHLEFITAAAYLRAENYSIAYDGSDIAAVAGALEVPKFVPQKAHIQVEENEKPPENKEVNALSFEELVGLLPPASSIPTRMTSIEFEKDDDANHHIEFIAACSNLRARNYKIPEADRQKTKKIAGKIIPAMVTTTALATGLVCLEWYKLIQDKPTDAYKNSFCNLALPLITFSDPMAPLSAQYGDTEWTLWDRFDVNQGKDITLQEFIDYFAKEHKFEISMISSGASMVYSFFTSKDKLRERLRKPISEVVKEVSKIDFPVNQSYINMEICCALIENDEDVDVPYVRYKFRNF